MARNEIRKEISRLLNQISTLEGNVFQMRSLNWMPEELPACSISTDGERAELWTVSPRVYKRTMSVAIVCYLEEETNIVDEIDEMATTIEAVLLTDTTLNETCDDVIYTGSNFEISTDGDATYSALSLNFDIVYTDGEHGINPEDLPLIKKHYAQINCGDESLKLEIDLTEGQFPNEGSDDE